MREYKNVHLLEIKDYYYYKQNQQSPDKISYYLFLDLMFISLEKLSDEQLYARDHLGCEFSMENCHLRALQ